VVKASSSKLTKPTTARKRSRPCLPTAVAPLKNYPDEDIFTFPIARKISGMVDRMSSNLSSCCEKACIPASTIARVTSISSSLSCSGILSMVFYYVKGTIGYNFIFPSPKSLSSATQAPKWPSPLPKDSCPPTQLSCSPEVVAVPPKSAILANALPLHAHT